MSGQKSRRKGARAQCEVVNLHQAKGIAAENIGTMYKAGPDISVPVLGVDRTLEVKIRASGYERQYNHLAENWAYWFRRNHSPWLVTLRGDDLLELMYWAEVGRDGCGYGIWQRKKAAE